MIEEITNLNALREICIGLNLRIQRIDERIRYSTTKSGRARSGCSERLKALRESRAILVETIERIHDIIDSGKAASTIDALDYWA